MATFVNSARSKPMLSLNGFLYTQNSKNKKGDRQYWRCSERDKCNARSTTDVFNPTHVVHDDTLKHTHPPITPEIKAKEAVDRIQRRAQDHPNEPPQQVIAPELRNEHNEEVLAHLPEHQNLRRSVNRMQNRSRPNNPADLNSLDIVEPYTTTIRGSSSCSTTPGQTMKNGYLFLQQKKICVYFAKVRWFSRMVHSRPPLICSPNSSQFTDCTSSTFSRSSTRLQLIRIKKPTT